MARWTPTFSAKVVAKALLATAALAIALGLGAGVWIGSEWQAGRQAKAELARAEADIAALGAQVREFREAMALASADFAGATERLTTIAEKYDHDRSARARADADLVRQLEAALVNRPDLDAVRVGPELLRAWNAANAGRLDPARAAGPDGADATGAGAADRAVSGAAAARAGRRGADPAAQSPRERGDLSRLSGASGRSGRRRARTRTHRGRAHRARTRGDGRDEEVRK